MRILLDTPVLLWVGGGTRRLHRIADTRPYDMPGRRSADDHRDPFDRLLIAQAIAEPAPLYTADDALPPYSELVRLVGQG
jgi:PIN domain nuclease of toxin-antitoxin system